MRRRRFLAGALGAPAALLTSGLGGAGCGPGGPSAVLGAKTYSEQIILGELLARLLRASGLAVTERFQMQTFVLHTAIANGDLDCYIEYTGTSYSAIMHETFVAGQTAEEIYERVKELYRERFDLRLAPRSALRTTTSSPSRGTSRGKGASGRSPIWPGSRTTSSSPAIRSSRGPTGFAA